MINIINNKDCTGCMACYNICPKNCIFMEEDKNGFAIARIDKEKCIKCNLCSKICPMLNKPIRSKKFRPLKVLGAINNDKKILKSSTSGGIFVPLAKKIIDDKGVVYGAKYDKNFNIIHDRTEKYEGVLEFSGSKYSESNIGNTFKMAKKDLENNRKVLFSGTPCQISGLLNYLQKEYDNLIICDFVCNGYISPNLFNAYKKYYFKEYGEITGINFRDKKNGWKNFNLSFSFKNNKKRSYPSYSHPYFLIYFNNKMMRDSCYECKFKYLKSGSDIKLSDFWDVYKINNEKYNYWGVSQVSINTKKGENFIKLISEEVTFFDSSFEEMLENTSFSNEKIEYNEESINFNDDNEKIIKYLKSKYKKGFFPSIITSIRVFMAKIKYFRRRK